MKRALILVAMLTLSLSTAAAALSIGDFTGPPRDVDGAIVPENGNMNTGGNPIPNTLFKRTGGSKFGNSYRVYAFIQYCYDKRQGYLSHVEIDRAREKITAIEAPFILAYPALDSTELFYGAVKSLSDPNVGVR